MEYRELGKTGLQVSRLCFGSLTVGSLQADLSVAEGSKIMAYAFEQGVNFVDTADYYQNYEYIREAIKGRKDKIIITSKSYDYTGEGMEARLHKALRGIERDYIDIFMLHEQESALTIQGHWAAIEYLLKAREKGLVRAIGISTHAVEAVRSAALIPEIEVIHPLLNKSGIGIIGGDREQMQEAIQYAHTLGKGIYSMKALGGGNLLGEREAAFNYILSLDFLDAVAVGMQSQAEVDFNVRLFSGLNPLPETVRQISVQPRRLLVESWCVGCGSCQKRCSSGAIRVVEGKAVVDQKLCRLCGYCAAVCPEFCLKII